MNHNRRRALKLILATASVLCFSFAGVMSAWTVTETVRKTATEGTMLLDYSWNTTDGTIATGTWLPVNNGTVPLILSGTATVSSGTVDDLADQTHKYQIVQAPGTVQNLSANYNVVLNNDRLVLYNRGTLPIKIATPTFTVPTALAACIMAPLAVTPNRWVSPTSWGPIGSPTIAPGGYAVLSIRLWTRNLAITQCQGVSGSITLKLTATV